ncbi:MAG: endonuclease/exonuclease/phosphatase family protein [Desulfobacterales bacterium]|jgi:endonuclease/exonuclease/phosphatase family metal-dependent hydrolase
MKDNTTDECITIVNLNAWFGLDCRGIFKFGEYESDRIRNARLENLSLSLVNLQPDVIGIQEANKLPAYADKLSKTLDLDNVWKITNSGIKFFGFGIPLNFSAGSTIMARNRHKLNYLDSARLSGKGIQSKWVSIHFSEMRDVVAARVVINGHPLIIFNTQLHYSVIWSEKWAKHLRETIDRYNLSSTEREELLASIHKSQNRRKQEIARLIDFVKKIVRRNDDPYVIMGDFNTTTDSPEMRHFIGELDLLDAYRIKNPHHPGYTWNPATNTNTGYDGSSYWADGVTSKDTNNKLKAQFDRKFGRRIDFVFLSYQFEPNMLQEAQLIFTEPVNGLFISDHFGLQVVLNQIP